MGDNVD